VVLTVPLVGGAAVAVALVGWLTLVRPGWVPALLVPTIVFEEIDLAGVSIPRLGGALALAGLVFAAAHRRLHKPVSIGAPVLFAFGAVAVASLVWSVRPDATLDELVALVVMVITGAAFALLPKTRSDLMAVAWTFVAVASAMAVWWIGSYAAGTDRFENAAGDPNRIAAYLVIAAPMALALAASRRSAWQRLALRAVAVLLVAGALSTLSRGVLLAVAAMGVLVMAVPPTWLFRSRAERRGMVLAASVAVIAVAAFVGPALVERFQDRPAGTEVTGTRGDLWAAAARTYGDHPVTGIGFGAFRASSFDVLRATPGVSLRQHLPEALREGRYVHNAYLEALTELGPVGLGLLLAVLFASLADAARAARHAVDRQVAALGAAALVGTAAFMASSLTLSTLTARVFGLLVGLTAAVATTVDLEMTTDGC
jgi:putative inorganic carbon (HCO3(-)) transporter